MLLLFLICLFVLNNEYLKSEDFAMNTVWLTPYLGYQPSHCGETCYSYSSAWLNFYHSVISSVSGLYFIAILSKSSCLLLGCFRAIKSRSKSIPEILVSWSGVNDFWGKEMQDAIIKTAGISLVRRTAKYITLQYLE